MHACLALGGKKGGQSFCLKVKVWNSIVRYWVLRGIRAPGAKHQEAISARPHGWRPSNAKHQEAI